MGFLDWLTGKKQSSKGTGAIKFINSGLSLVYVKIFGGRKHALQVPARSDDLTQVPAGKYFVRFQFDDEFEVYQSEEFSVNDGAVVSFTMPTGSGGAQRAWPVKGPL